MLTVKGIKQRTRRRELHASQSTQFFPKLGSKKAAVKWLQKSRGIVEGQTKKKTNMSALNSVGRKSRRPNSKNNRKRRRSTRPGKENRPQALSSKIAANIHYIKTGQPYLFNFKKVCQRTNQRLHTSHHTRKIKVPTIKTVDYKSVVKQIADRHRRTKARSRPHTTKNSSSKMSSEQPNCLHNFIIANILEEDKKAKRRSRRKPPRSKKSKPICSIVTELRKLHEVNQSTVSTEDNTASPNSDVRSIEGCRKGRPASSAATTLIHEPPSKADLDQSQANTDELNNSLDSVDEAEETRSQVDGEQGSNLKMKTFVPKRGDTYHHSMPIQARKTFGTIPRWNPRRRLRLKVKAFNKGRQDGPRSPAISKWDTPTERVGFELDVTEFMAGEGKVTGKRFKEKPVEDYWVAYKERCRRRREEWEARQKPKATTSTQ